MEKVRAGCPIERFAGELILSGRLDEGARADLQASVEAEVARAIGLAESAPFPDPAEALSDVG
jgi:TPP-dependent pyruvate/acetoin dehydrogenase alpha subunit